MDHFLHMNFHKQNNLLISFQWTHQDINWKIIIKSNSDKTKKIVRDSNTQNKEKPADYSEK
jgi:hypothetical protein